MNDNSNNGLRRHKTTDERLSTSETEPADPEVNHPGRKSTRIAPDNLDSNNFPTPLLECGCGSCPDSCDPLANKYDEDNKQYTGNCCDNPVPVTIRKARRILVAYNSSNYQNSKYHSKYQAHLQTYAELREADRQLRERYDNPTTVLLSRRLSPLNEDGHWRRPYELIESLHGVKRGINRKLRRTLKRHDFWADTAYMGMTAYTDYHATPHEHILIYIDDRHSHITRELFEPAIEYHVKNVTGAYQKHHQNDTITVRHDPPNANISNKKAGQIVLRSDTHYTNRFGVSRIAPSTAGMVYVASQLPYLPLRYTLEFSNLNRADTDLQSHLEGGAISWCSSRDAVRTSQKWPTV